ncbi:hypothetical protein DOC35_19430 [Salmonella enterica subsp. enterica]|nr:hypothetical protein [Salmonella enterica subsp. enterica]
MKKAACFILLALCASAQAYTPAELQYQQDQLNLMKARNRCAEIAAAQQQEQRGAFVLPPPADIAEAARNAPPLTLEICEANYYRKSAELDARQPQEIKDDNARRAQEFDAREAALNAEAIR